MNDLTLIDEKRLAPQYRSMIAVINDALPAIDRDSASFHKSHSQFMTATLDITQLTPIRSIKHTLAEISRTRQALEEASIKIKRKDIKARVIEARLSNAAGFEAQRLRLKLDEIAMHRRNVEQSMGGAIRKLAHLVAQHKALLAKIGKDEITEADYEAEEARYHTMTVLKQALCAARSRGGIVDEGNNIYLFDMGLPASLVQRRILEYLASETEQTTHADTIAWMEALADEIQHYAAENAARRGVLIRDDKSILGASDADSV